MCYYILNIEYFIYVPIFGHCAPKAENINQIGLFTFLLFWISFIEFCCKLFNIIYPLHGWSSILYAYISCNKRIYSTSAEWLAIYKINNFFKSSIIDIHCSTKLKDYLKSAHEERITFKFTYLYEKIFVEPY